VSCHESTTYLKGSGKVRLGFGNPREEEQVASEFLQPCADLIEKTAQHQRLETLQNTSSAGTVCA
ncbi:MAG: hypothetical protein ABTS16_07675, partial [Candidatus Accumulibacter phosphatis]